MQYPVTFNIKDIITTSNLSGIVFNAGDASADLYRNSPFTYNYATANAFISYFKKSPYVDDHYYVDLLSLQNITLASKFSSSIDATWYEGSATGTATGGAAVAAGWLDLAHDDARYVSYSAVGNANFQQIGTIKTLIKPNYSATPATNQYIFSISNADASDVNLISLYHSGADGHIYCDVYDSTSTPILNAYDFGAWSPTSGTTYEIELNIDITAGATRLFIDGTQLGATDVSTGVRDANINKILIGQDIVLETYTSNFSIKDFIVFTGTQHITDYTAGYSILDNPVVVNLSMYSHVTLSTLGNVWDELIASHNIADTFGAKNQKLIPSETISDYYTDLTPVTSNMALDSTVAKELTLTTLAGVVALDSTVAKELTLTTLAGVVALDSTVAKELTLTTLAGVVALDSTVAKEATLSALAGVVALDATVAKEATLTLVKTETDKIPTLSLEATSQLIKDKTDRLQFTLANDLQTRINDSGVITTAYIGNATWDTTASTHITADTFGYIVNQIDIFGTDNNRYIDQCVYVNNALTSCRIRVYSVPASVGTTNDVIATFLVTATQTNGKMTTFKEVQQ